MKRTPLLALLALAGCATVPPASAGPTAAIGETATVGGLTIRPVELLEDSRCPASVQCVWAGQVRIRAIIAPERLTVPTGPNAPSTAVAREIDMTLGIPVVEFGRSVMLSSAAPTPAVPGKLDLGSYRFTFTLTPGP